MPVTRASIPQLVFELISNVTLLALGECPDFEMHEKRSASEPSNMDCVGNIPIQTHVPDGAPLFAFVPRGHLLSSPPRGLNVIAK